MSFQPRTPVSRTTGGGDLYIRLLRLGEQSELEPFLREALALVVDVVGADQGYLQLVDEERPAEQPWWIAHGFSQTEVEEVRLRVSSGIIAQAIATGQTITTPSALLDPRFRDRESVQDSRIGAVVCAPIGGDPPLGVLYLHGGSAAGSFSPSQLSDVEIFARHLAPYADRLIVRRRRQEEADATHPLRRALRLDGVIGVSGALARVLRQVALVAPLDVNVLITGESGTGKSQIARVIHQNGPRGVGPFVEISCGALPETLIESELFGALPGAHSTATRRVEGKVAAAERGTLFLDEVTELPVGSQAKLLQLLQSRQYYPLGASRPVPANVRVIAATNVEVHSAIASRRFREDLFYRLAVLPIRMPSLSERREDVPALAAYFCADTCVRHRLSTVTLSPRALAALQSVDWPGNVRQLAHAVEAAVIRAAGESAERVECVHLFAERSALDDGAPGTLTFQEATRRFQAQLLLKTLTEAGWNVGEVARRLDLARSYVYKMINAFGLDRPK